MKLVLTLALLICSTHPGLSAPLPPVKADTGMVATDHKAASIVGAQMLRQGGDAVDAAVAATLMLGVVQPFGSGLGGGGFALVRRASGKTFVLDFREVAPQNAFRDMFLNRDKTPMPNASRRGALAAAVPGELAGLAELHRRHGRLPWKTVVRPAQDAAKHGFPCGQFLHKKIAEYASELRTHPRLASIFLTKSGQAKAVGTLIRQPNLARSLQAIAKDGVRDFYEGALAKRIIASIRDGGGLMSLDDLSGYRWRIRKALEIDALNAQFIGMPPPSSGGAVLAQVLSLIEPVKLKAKGHNKPAYIHEIIEYLKHGFADRANVMGDPDFTKVPIRAMLSHRNRHRIQSAFDPKRTLPNEEYGGRYAPTTDGGTSHLSIVDGQGNAIALTTTINTSFGSMFVAGDTGIIMNNEMDDFVIRPGVPNAFGLIGRKANEIVPGKRPLSSMSPTMIVHNGKIRLVIGASGGPTIISSTLQVILNIMIFGMDAQHAVTAPRFHHQWQPDILFHEDTLDRASIRVLNALGHRTKVRPRFSAVQVVAVSSRGMQGAADPSKHGQPVGVRSDGKLERR